MIGVFMIGVVELLLGERGLFDGSKWLGQVLIRC